MNHAQRSLFRGVNRLNNIVKITLGPDGQNVIIDRDNGSPLITNDGVTIAGQVTLRDRHERLGADIIKQASNKTNEEAGDGTTSAIVLATAIVNQARHALRWGYAPQTIKTSLLAAAGQALENLPACIRRIYKRDDLAAVATNSCGDPSDGALVAKAITKVGENGLVTLQTNQLGVTDLIFASGVKIATQITSPYFNDQEYLDAQILVTDSPINSLKEIIPLLENCVQKHQPLVLLAPDFAPTVLNALLLNRSKANLAVMALRTELTADCAAVTGATLISARNGLSLAQATPAHCGIAPKVCFQPDETIFIGCTNNDALRAHTKLLRQQITAAPNNYEKTRLQERLANLTTTAAIITVGCATPAETMEKRLRLEDAIATTTNALKEGIVPGAGLTYQTLAKQLSRNTIGERLLKRALPAISQQIKRNCHLDPKQSQAVDAATVIRCVVKNAVSAAAILITTGAIISNAT